MKKRNKVILLLVLIAVLVFAFSISALAITDSDVQAQVDSQGKEAVSGSVFIWFLCAIAFLKVSQKIDSFMASLGINVGNTGGSMVAELMIAGRAISGIMGRGFGRSGGGASSSSGTSGGGGKGPANPLQGGLAGAVGRKVQGGAAASATDFSGSASSGGIFAGIGGSVFQKSLNKSGDYANNVIGAVAKGNISQMGSITGDKAAAALKSYMNIGGGAQTAQTVEAAAPLTAPVESAGVPLSGAEGIGIPVQPGGIGISDPGMIDTDVNILSHSQVTENIESPGIIESSSDGVPTSAGIPYTQGIDPIPNAVGTAIPASAAPDYSGVEIGGGRITGYESIPGGGESRQFTMYSADQYLRPESKHETLTAVDGSKWYRQYAQPAVEKTPYKDEADVIKYNEKIVQRMPPVPRRKDRS